MFKVVALLALVGACSAGVLHAGLPLTYSTLGHAVVPNAGLVADGRIASLRDAAALNSQIATQNAINTHGAVRNAVLQGGVYSAGVPAVYSAGVPAVYSAGVIPNAGLVADGRITSLRDAAALNSQIATQNAINAGVLNTGAGVYYV